jgi:hypothetical protein
MTKPTQTLGEYRVGTTFNPSNDDTVSKLKQAAARIIDMVSDRRVSIITPNRNATAIAEVKEVQDAVTDYRKLVSGIEVNPITHKSDVAEVYRLKELAADTARQVIYNMDTGTPNAAMKAMELSAMWAVKAATKPPRA